MNSTLDEDKPELGVFVFSVLLKVLSHRDSLLDQHVKVLGDGGCEARLLEDAEDLGAGDALDLGDATGISEDNANLDGEIYSEKKKVVRK